MTNAPYGKLHWLREALDEGDVGHWTLTHAEAGYLIEIAEAARDVVKMRERAFRRRPAIGIPVEWDRLRAALDGLEVTP